MRSFAERLRVFKTPMLYSSWVGIQRGIEKEGLRVTPLGFLSKTPHPKALGSSLTHPFITTDYSEALLELITEPTTDMIALFQQLTQLHNFTYRSMGDEYLWASSMPCRLPPDNQIPIAEYGHSNLGKVKRLYRKGLGYRYGRSMQTIAGIHYNFSLPIAFWEAYRDSIESTGTSRYAKTSLSAFISEQYLGMIRNVFRHGWLLALLLGASPSVSKTFFQSTPIPDFLQPLDFDGETLIAPYATSLRLSDLGYHNKTGGDTFISYNSLTEFLNTVQNATHTRNPDYTRIGVLENGHYKQLNDNVLQTEDEHYALIRPKCRIHSGERQWKAIRDRGIEYLEIRALDINPFVPLGIDAVTVRMLDAFLMMCLVEESPPLMHSEMQSILEHHNRIAKEGRKLLTDRETAKKLILKMQSVAAILDKAYDSHHWAAACLVMLQRLEQPETLTSARVLTEMRDRKESYFAFAMRWSRIHKHQVGSIPLSQDQIDFYVKMSESSEQQQALLEQETHLSFDEYLHQYLSIE